MMSLHSPIIPSLLLLLLALFHAGAATDNVYRHHHQHPSSAETPTIRTFFYVGGEYVDDGDGGHIFQNQMYVEKLAPAENSTAAATHHHPIVMIHGQAQTGTNFLNKPDGGTGWASRLIEQGHTVYIVDQTFRGRSAWKPGAGADTPSTYSAELIEQRFTAPEQFSPQPWPQARLHTQWAGPGRMGDAVFDAFYASNVPFIANATYQQSAVQAAGAALLDLIAEPVILLGHSQGGLMPPLIADARPALTAAMILLEPSGPPFQNAVFTSTAARKWGLTDTPLTYSPPVTDPEIDLVKRTYPPPVATTDNSTVPCILQARKPKPRTLPNLAPKPILILTTQASYHAPYDYCTAKYYKQAGCERTTHLELGREGVLGNGHMVFLEENSDEVLQLVREWIDREV